MNFEFQMSNLNFKLDFEISKFKYQKFEIQVWSSNTLLLERAQHLLANQGSSTLCARKSLRRHIELLFRPTSFLILASLRRHQKSEGAPLAVAVAAWLAANIHATCEELCLLLGRKPCGLRLGVAGLLATAVGRAQDCTRHRFIWLASAGSHAASSVLLLLLQPSFDAVQGNDAVVQLVAAVHFVEGHRTHTCARAANSVALRTH